MAEAQYAPNHTIDPETGILENKGYDEGYKLAETKCTEYTIEQNKVIKSLKLENQNKTRRLSLFNQIDGNGDLLPLKKTIKSSEIGDPREGS